MNKKIIVVTTIIAVCLGLIFAGTKVYATTGKALNDTTRIRKKATTDSEVVTTLDKGEKIEVLSEEGDWYKIQYKSSNGKEVGYVRNDLLEVEKTETKNEQEVENKESKDTEKKESENKKEENNSEDKAESTSAIIIEENMQIELKNETEVQLLPVIFSCKTGKVSSKEKVTVTELVGNWCHIESDNLEGWVLTSKIEDNQNKIEENKNQEETKQEEEKKEETKKEETQKVEGIERKLYVSTTTLNLREKADVKSDVVTQLDQNDEVTVIEVIDSTWSKVKAKGYTGYTASEYLSSKKASDTTSRGAQEIRNSENNKTEKKEEVKKEEKKTETVESNKTSTNKETKTNTTTSNTWKVESNNITTSKTTSSTKKTESKQTTTNNKTTTSSKEEKKGTGKTTGAEVIAYAKKFLGRRYVYGASGPDTFDCSGFTSYVFRHFGYSLDRTSAGQRSNGKAVNKSDKQPGDLLCFSGHVGIYIGGNKFIHASHTGDYVKISSLSGYYTNKRPVIAVRRIIN